MVKIFTLLCSVKKQKNVPSVTVFSKVRFFKERTWQSIVIQKFAKTAPSIPSCVGGQFLQIFGSLYFVKYVLKKMDFNYREKELLSIFANYTTHYFCRELTEIFNQ